MILYVFHPLIFSKIYAEYECNVDTTTNVISVFSVDFKIILQRDSIGMAGRNDVLVNMSSVSKEIKEPYVDIGFGGILSIMEMNMYDMCLMKVNSVGKILKRMEKSMKIFYKKLRKL